MVLPGGHFLYGFPFPFALDPAIGPYAVLPRSDVRLLDRLILHDHKPAGIALGAHDPVDINPKRLIEFEAVFLFRQF